MRTTITIDEGLLKEVKRVASETRSTVSRVIGDSLRLTLSAKRSGSGESETFELLTFGRGGRFSKFNIDKAATLVEAEDLERFGRVRESD